MYQKKSFSKKETKRSFSHEGTKSIVEAIKIIIKNPRERKEVISTIKALDLKKIRNTSKT